MVGVRLITENDIPWLIDLGNRRYPVPCDPITTEGWVRNVVLKSPMIFYAARTQNAYCICLLSVCPWYPSEFEVNMVFLCAEEGAMYEALKLLRCSIAWSKGRKATYWKMASNTDYDLAPLAKRLGAEEMLPRWVVRL